MRERQFLISASGTHGPYAEASKRFLQSGTCQGGLDTEALRGATDAGGPVAAFANLQEIGQRLAGRYRIENVALLKNPTFAKRYQIVAHTEHGKAATSTGKDPHRGLVQYGAYIDRA